MLLVILADEILPQLIRYMKICFIALHSIIKDMAFDAIKNDGVNFIQYFKKIFL